jgi:hypothetical protein
MNRQQFETLLDELVKTAGQEESHIVARKKIMLAFTKMQREIDRLEEDVILQAYKK